MKVVRFLFLYIIIIYNFLKLFDTFSALRYYKLSEFSGLVKILKKNKKQNEQLIMQGVPPKEEEPVSLEENLTEVKEEVCEGQVSVFDSTEIGETIIDPELVEERLKEAIETEKPKKKKKSIITNLLFLALNVFVLAFIIKTFLNETDGVSLKSIISMQGNKLWWLVLGLGLFIVMFFADSMMISCLLKRSTGKRRLLTSYKVSATGKYFESITPFAVGGQPAQILSLSKSGIAPGLATSIPIIKVIIYNIVYTVVIFCFLVFAVPFIPVTSSLNSLLFTLFKIFAFIGLIFTALTSVVFILIGSGKIVGRSMVRWVVRLGYKLRIVKDFRKSYNKVMNQVLEYQSSIKYLRNNKGTLFACIFFALLEVLAYFAIPFTAVMAFTPTTITGFVPTIWILFVCMTNVIVCQMAAVVIPLPGGTGMMEFSFIALFGVSTLIGSTNVIWGLLAWRFLTYYFTIIQGFVISTTESIVRMVKARKVAKQDKEIEKQ